MTEQLKAGAVSIDISPETPQFLFGYPHVERFSEGIHDPIMASALCLSDGETSTMFIGNDICLLEKSFCKRVRIRISEKTGIPSQNIMVSATHTHSAPHTTKHLSNKADPVVPDPDPEYLERLESGIVKAGIEAASSLHDAEIGLSIADGSAVGTNRRDPTGPSDPRVPVLCVRSADSGKPIAIMIVCSMHPTVLHEDSKLVSADFLWAARDHVCNQALKTECPVVCHMGPSGNQSPRHVTKANTFEEAERLGSSLGKEIARALKGIEYERSVSITVINVEEQLPPREFPKACEAQAKLEAAAKRLEALRDSNAPKAETRTAECDWFGAEETLVLARAAESGQTSQSVQACMPAEIQIIRIGKWSFVGWPCEIFVDFALAVKKQCKNTFVISLANGETQGYLVTADAAGEGGYEASNSLFKSPESGDILVRRTVELLS